MPVGRRDMDRHRAMIKGQIRCGVSALPMSRDIALLRIATGGAKGERWVRRGSPGVRWTWLHLSASPDTGPGRKDSDRRARHS